MGHCARTVRPSSRAARWISAISDSAVSSVPAISVHLLRVIALNEVRLPAVSDQQRGEFLVRDPARTVGFAIL